MKTLNNADSLYYRIYKLRKDNHLTDNAIELLDSLDADLSDLADELIEGGVLSIDAFDGSFEFDAMRKVTGNENVARMLIAARYDNRMLDHVQYDGADDVNIADRIRCMIAQTLIDAMESCIAEKH